MSEETVDPQLNKDAPRADFPPRMFLYTLDQVAACISVSPELLKRNYVYFVGRNRKVQPKGLLAARNIAGPEQRPEWRIAENELVRWMKFKGFVFTTSSRLAL